MPHSINLKANHANNNQFNVNSDNKKELIRKAVLKACDLLGLTQKELSLIIGFSESKASRLSKNSAFIEPESKEWDLAIIFLRMYRSLDSLFGGYESQCRLWINAYNHHLRGIPKELIKNVEGLVEVTQYLDAYRGLS